MTFVPKSMGVIGLIMLLVFRENEFLRVVGATWLFFYISPKIIDFMWLKIKTHIKKIPYVFSGVVTILIAGTISYTLFKNLKWLNFWPYQMTILTLMLGFECYRTYKEHYPNPKNFKSEKFLSTPRI